VNPSPSQITVLLRGKVRLESRLTEAPLNCHALGSRFIPGKTIIIEYGMDNGFKVIGK